MEKEEAEYLLSVANNPKKFATKVVDDNKNDELIVTRLDNGKPALNVVHIYGRIKKTEMVVNQKMS